MSVMPRGKIPVFKIGPNRKDSNRKEYYEGGKNSAMNSNMLWDI